MVTAKSAGSGIGAFFNNPGVVAIALIGIGVLVFRKPIQAAIEGLAGSIGGLFSTSGPIFGAGQEAGQFVFNIGQDVGGAIFDAGAGAGQSVFDAGAAFGDFVGSTQNQIDQALKNFFDSQKADLDNFISEFSQDTQENITTLGDTAQKAAEEGGPLSGIFDLFGGIFGGEASQDLPELPFQGPNIDPTTGFSTFHIPIGHLCTFFRKMSIQVFCPFFNCSFFKILFYF